MSQNQDNKIQIADEKEKLSLKNQQNDGKDNQNAKNNFNKSNHQNNQNKNYNNNYNYQQQNQYKRQQDNDKNNYKQYSNSRQNKRDQQNNRSYDKLQKNNSQNDQKQQIYMKKQNPEQNYHQYVKNRENKNKNQSFDSQNNYQQNQRQDKNYNQDQKYYKNKNYYSNKNSKTTIQYKDKNQNLDNQDPKENNNYKTDQNINNEKQKISQQIRQQYKEQNLKIKVTNIMQQKQKLPAFEQKQKFLDLINNEQQRIIIIQGETGSGKSTQIPQFILEDNNYDCDIVVTQPRIIAATSLADRVSQEVKETYTKNKSIVGYKTRFYQNYDQKLTKLTYVTEGILISELCKIKEKNIQQIKYKYIILDEVHERNINTDFLIGLMKIILTQNLKIKLILMSATIGIQQLMDFYKEQNPVIFTISGTLYPVKTIFLEEFKSQEQLEEEEENYEKEMCKQAILLEKQEKKLDQNQFQRKFQSKFVFKYLDHKNQLEEIEKQKFLTQYQNHKQNQEKIVDLVHNIHFKKEEGDILIFLTGEEEINTLKDQIYNCLEQTIADDNINDKDFIILPIYSTLQQELQQKVFQSYQNTRKIILATNIAETSITIEGIVYVIDNGFVKQIEFDPVTNRETLKIVPVSKASAQQRKGRAGRTKPGECYRVYTETQYNNFSEFVIPEIHRSNIQNVILQQLLFGIDGDIQNFPYIDKPTDLQLKSSIEQLTQMKAIQKGEKQNEYQLTNKGQQLAILPIDPILGLVLLKSYQLQCLEQVSIILAMIQTQGNLFQLNSKMHKDINKSMLNNEILQQGDLIIYLHIYNEFQKVQKETQNQWCQQQGLQLKYLENVSKVREQLLNSFFQNQKDQEIINQYINTPNIDINMNIIKNIQLSFLESYNQQISFDVGGTNYALFPYNQSIYFSKKSFFFKKIKDIQKKPFIILFTDCLVSNNETIKISNTLQINRQILQDYDTQLFSDSIISNPRKYMSKKEQEKEELEYEKKNQNNESDKPTRNRRRVNNTRQNKNQQQSQETQYYQYLLENRKNILTYQQITELQKNQQESSEEEENFIENNNWGTSDTNNNNWNDNNDNWGNKNAKNINNKNNNNWDNLNQSKNNW